MEEEKQTSNRPKKKRISFLYILSGGILKEDFVLKHIKMIILVVVLLFFFVGNRYTCLLKLRRINRLEQELEYIRYESIDIAGRLTDSNRLSQIEQLVESQGLKLESAQSPPYILRK